jgi:uncharacterized membrane protein YhaH (DUF805 family)
VRTLNALIALLGHTMSDRVRRLRDSGDRGSETTEKVLWIAFLVLLVAAVYAIFNSKIIAKMSGITL